MTNENKKTCEIIIKKDGETVVREKTNAIFCIINREESVKRFFRINKISSLDLLYILDAAQELIDQNIEEHEELELIWAIRRSNKLKDKVSKNEE